MTRQQQRDRSDERILEAIKKYYAEHGYMPSYREIGAMVGLSSNATIKYHMERLLMLGKIETDLDSMTLYPRAYRLGRD